MSFERLDAAAFANASAAIIDEDEDVHAWKSGTAFCACDSTKDADGRLASKGDCKCYRYNGVRIDEHGDPKINVEEIEPEPRTDALEGIVNKAGYKWTDGTITSWVFDGASVRVPVVVNDHNLDESAYSVGVARCRLDANGDLRTRIEFYPGSRARDAIARVKSGDLKGLSPRFMHSYKDRSAKLRHVALVDRPRGPEHLITKTFFRTDASPLSTLGGVVDAVDRVRRTAHVTASTTDIIDGEAITRWDLDRFMLNPVVLWSHDADLPPIGRARDVAFDQEAGLTMTIEFAAATNERAEEIFLLVAADMLRGISVGYVVENGVAVLDEISVVSLPADPNALVNNPKENVMKNDALSVDEARAQRDQAMASAWRTDAKRAKIRKSELRALLPGQTFAKGELKALRNFLGIASTRVINRNFLERALEHVRGERVAAVQSASRTDASETPDIEQLRARRDALALSAGR